ncbi:MAG TPA: T9SS type A sorting domain-containing protein [Bacteroidia bacterium]|nr:T9SS type A sorting domain-containing protein [Bacteroidia bacterium]
MCTFAQPATFLKTYNSGNSGMMVREVNGNAYVVAGATDFYYNYHWMIMSPVASTNIHLFKTSTDGTLIWEKIFNKPGSRSIAIWMEPAPDSGIIITGHMNKDVAWPPDSNDIFLMKTDSGGSLLWSKQFDTGKDELGYCVRPTFDGGYIIAGFHDAAPVSLGGTTYALLIKTDGNGNLLWGKKYELAVRDLDTGESLAWIVRQTADSGYVLVGTTAASHAADVLVIRTTSSGDVVWSNSYEHDNTLLRFSLGLDIIESLSGDFIIAGSMDKDQSLTQYNYPYILKINSTGNLLDSRFYDSAPPQQFQAGFSSVEQTPDGGFFFTGMGGYGGFGMQAQLLKTDANFNMQWSRAYSNDAAATVGSRSGRRTSDGCYIFTGKRQNDGAILWKADPFGLVPCKTPGTLLEMLPGIIQHNHFPGTISGINESNSVFVPLPALTDTSTICPVTDATLPVELLSFSANLLPDKLIQLRWETGSESNNDYFILRKSLDGKKFTDIGMVNGAGNSSSVQSYSLLDKITEITSILYYRLEQVDYDGAHRISRTLPVSLINEELILLSVAADQSSQTITVLLQSNSLSPIQCSFTDMLGKTYSLQSGESGNGIREIRIDAQPLSKGIYFLTFSDNEHTITGRVVY